MGQTAAAWGGNYLGLPPSRGWLAWVKNNATNSFSSVELAWSNMDFNAKHFVAPVGCPLSEKAGHPTQKPIALMRWCLSFLPDAKLILDPFSGSFSTGVACVKEGKAFIGIELDAEYYAIGCKRIEDAYRQPDMFLAPQPKPEQQSML